MESQKKRKRKAACYVGPRGHVTHKTKVDWYYIHLLYLWLARVLERNLRAGKGVRAKIVANDAGSNPDAVLVARECAYFPLLGRIERDTRGMISWATVEERLETFLGLWKLGGRGEEHVPSAVELSKEIAARRSDVAVVWTGDTLLARSCLSALKRARKDARKEHEKEEEGCLEEHVWRMWYWVLKFSLRRCIW